jgi:hypothetical protein
MDGWWQGLTTGLAIGDFSAALDTRVPCRGQGYEGAMEGAAVAWVWWQRVAARVGSKQTTDLIWSTNGNFLELTDGSHH